MLANRTTNILIITLLFCCCQSKYLLAANLTVVNSILPLWHITNAIGGKKINNILLINPSDSEHDFQLKPKDLLHLQQARLIFYVSDQLESFMQPIKQTIEQSGGKIINVADYAKIALLTNENKQNNWHIWLNPHNILAIADLQLAKFCDVDADNCIVYQQNHKHFVDKIQQAINVSKQNKKSINGNIIAFDDAYQYFFDFYNIDTKLVLTSHHQDGIKINKMSQLLQITNKTCIVAETDNLHARKIATKYNLTYIDFDLFFINGDIAKSILDMANKINKCNL